MDKKQAIGAGVTFAVICLCGLFVGFASGVEWGTPACGWFAGTTFWAALILAPMGGMLSQD